MKNLITIPICLFIISCQQKYNYVIEVEKCNGKTEIYSFEAAGIKLRNYKRAVPELAIAGDGPDILNVCDYRIISKEAIK